MASQSIFSQCIMGSDNCLPSSLNVGSNSLDFDFIHADIVGRVRKTSIIIAGSIKYGILSYAD